MPPNNLEAEKKILENFLGIPIKRIEFSLASKGPYDEVFGNLCHRFYGQEKEIKKATILTTRLILNATTAHAYSQREISLLFSLLGTCHYLQEHYTKSIGCFLKALSWYREDMTPWIELMFAIRASGEYTIFESILFNLEPLYLQWKSDSASELDREKLLDMIDSLMDQ